MSLAVFWMLCHPTQVQAIDRKTVNTGPIYRNVVNGSFETPTMLPGGYAFNPSGTGWSFQIGTGISSNNSGFTSGNPNAPNGSQVLFLMHTGTVSRPLAMGPGTFRLQLRAAQRGNRQASFQEFEVRVDGKTVATIRPEGTNYGTYYTSPFTLVKGSETLELVGLNPMGGDNTVFIDHIRSQAMRKWSDQSAWLGGNIPTFGDDVTITADAALMLDQDVTLESMTILGKLYADRSQDLDLTANQILVEGPGAILEWGTPDDPYLMRGEITLTGTSSSPQHLEMGTKFLAAHMGGRINMHGAPQVSWTHLAQDVNANQKVIHLTTPVSWGMGDTIVITSSRVKHFEAEKRAIAQISQDGLQVTLDQKLNYPHYGLVKTYTQDGRSWTAHMQAEVGLLTHNITIRGEAPGASGFGGHIMLHTNAYAKFDGVELYNMGQKSILGRYPFHWHMLGDIGEGQYFKNSSVHRSFNRAITIHGTESTLVDNNFFYDHIGHGVFLEDGSERFNVIRKNVTLLTKRPAPGEEVTPSDNQFAEVQNRTPASYWITNPHNIFEDNVAAGTEGTGYWFAFPRTPMGLSATDPRFMNMEPYKMDMLTFKGNKAHSCKGGFDIFDQLSPDHAIEPNKGWANSNLHVMDSCTWYANELALYSGTGKGEPTENLIFRNNILVENRLGTMFASYNIVENSVFVAKSGRIMVNGPRAAYRTYDGAGRLYNNHFVGWDDDDANFIDALGGSFKHVNHLLQGNTTDHPGFVRMAMPDFDLPPAQAGATDPEHPRRWSNILRDLDGSISGVANTSIISNHPFMRLGDEFRPSNWTNVYRTSRHYALSRVTYLDMQPASFPNVVVSRTKLGTPTEHVYYNHGYKEHHQLPFIVNGGFRYTYQYETLPSSKKMEVYMEDAMIGDRYIARFKDFGKLGGLTLNFSQGNYPPLNSLAALTVASVSAYYLEPNGDLYLKFVATQRDQLVGIAWNTNFVPPKIDTDGDEMADGIEMINGRNPFTAEDLAAEFATNGAFEGWSDLRNIAGGTVTNGVLKGTANNNGDANVINESYNFQASEVGQLEIRMKASANTGVQMFFATAAQPEFSSSRVRGANYTGNGAWQIVTLPMSAHGSWAGTITGLRFDPVGVVGRTFEIDWIRAVGVAQNQLIGKTADEGAAEPEAQVQVYPNPIDNWLRIEMGASHAFKTVRLVDLQGRILRESKLVPGQQQMEWSFANQPLAPGVYFIQLNGEGKDAPGKVLKVMQR